LRTMTIDTPVDKTGVLNASFIRERDGTSKYRWTRWPLCSIMPGDNGTNPTFPALRYWKPLTSDLKTGLGSRVGSPVAVLAPAVGGGQGQAAEGQQHHAARLRHR
jgi:hypothetical protein